ncbi:MAG: hypothetical protein R3D58_14185 [Saprospiraceae bacterium]
MKEQANIQALLDRYWEGETTLDEERQLKAFFSAGNIPEAYQAFAPYFQALQAEHAVQLPGNRQAVRMHRPLRWFRLAAAAVIAILLTAGVFWWTGGPAQQEQQALAPVMPPKIETPQPALTPSLEPAANPVAESQVPKKQTRKGTVRKTRSVAPEPAPEDTYEDPEAALAEIKAALALVSSKINRSKHTLEKGLQEVNHVDILHKKKKETDG